jgi:hypothetical protein
LGFARRLCGVLVCRATSCNRSCSRRCHHALGESLFLYCRHLPFPVLLGTDLGRDRFRLGDRARFGFRSSLVRRTRLQGDIAPQTCGCGCKLDPRCSSAATDSRRRLPKSKSSSSTAGLCSARSSPSTSNRLVNSSGCKFVLEEQEARDFPLDRIDLGRDRFRLGDCFSIAGTSLSPFYWALTDLRRWRLLHNRQSRATRERRDAPQVGRVRQGRFESAAAFGPEQVVVQQVDAEGPGRVFVSLLQAPPFPRSTGH